MAGFCPLLVHRHVCGSVQTCAFMHIVPGLSRMFKYATRHADMATPIAAHPENAVSQVAAAVKRMAPPLFPGFWEHRAFLPDISASFWETRP